MFILIGSLVVLTAVIAFCVKAKPTRAKSLSDVKDPNYASLKGFSKIKHWCFLDINRLLLYSILKHKNF